MAREGHRVMSVGARVGWIALGLIAFAPSASSELYRWTDEQGRVRYSNEPRAGSRQVEVESRIQVQRPETRPGEEPVDPVERARRQRREVQRWVDRQPSRRPGRDAGPRRIQRVIPSGDGTVRVLPQRPSETAEARCLRDYGKPCSELERWRDDAIEDCRRRNLSRDCKSEEYLHTQRPRTLRQRQEIRAKREKRRERRQRRVQRELEALRNR